MLRDESAPFRLPPPSPAAQGKDSFTRAPAFPFPCAAGKHRQDCRCWQRTLPEGRATSMWRVQGAPALTKDGAKGGALRLSSASLKLCLIALLFLGPRTSHAATTPVHYGLFGDVHVASAGGEPKRTVIFISDKDGWSARAESLAAALSTDGALVFGIDTPAYLKEMLSIKNDACHFPSAHIQEMSDWMQKN